MATLEEVRQQADTLSPDQQRQLGRCLAQPTGTQVGRVWYLLISVLSIGALLSGVAAYNLYSGANKDAGALFLAITTTIVGGLIGLLAPSPVNQS